jgi:hypothetical protein
MDDRFTKFVVGCAGVLIILCLCIGVGWAVAERVAQPVLMFLTQATDNPQEINQIGQEILDYRLPERYDGQFGVDFLGIQLAGFGSEDPTDPEIMLMQLPDYFGLSPVEMENQLKQWLQNQRGQERVQMVAVDTLTVDIKDQRVKLMVGEGRNANGITFRQISGAFRGKNGVALLMIMGEKEKWDQRPVNMFFNSLR